MGCIHNQRVGGVSCRSLLLTTKGRTVLQSQACTKHDHDCMNCQLGDILTECSKEKEISIRWKNTSVKKTDGTNKQKKHTVEYL